jgi:hypothetical protein
VPKQGTETLVDNFSFSGATLAKAEWTEHRLIYLTPKLTEAVHLSGTPSITIKLASSKPAANLSVWLVSLPWNDAKNAKITDNIITRGWADPQNHRSLTESKPLVPGQFYEINFDLQPDDQIIPVGQQIALMIFASDRDFTLRPTPGTELSVDLDATFIELPVVGGAEALAKAVQEDAEEPKDRGKNNFGFYPPAKEVVRLLTTGFAGVYIHELLSLRESRALRPGEGLLNLQESDKFDSFKHALPGRYRVRPSRFEVVRL